MFSIIQQLLKQGIIDESQAESLKAEAKEKGLREEELLTGKKIADEGSIFSLKSKDLKIPLKTVVPEDVPLETFEIIPEETVEYYQMIPFSRKDNFFEIGMVYPEDLKAQEALNFLARQKKFSYKVFLIIPTAFNNLLKQYHSLKGGISEVLEELKMKGEVEETVEISKRYQRLAEEAPIVKIISTMLEQAVEGNASDIHIEPSRDKLRVRFRFLGQLYPSIFLPMRVHPAVVTRVKILSNLKIDEMRVPQDGRFSAKIAGKDIDFRVSTFPTPLGEKVAIRVLDSMVGMKKFEDLGLVGRSFETTKRAAQKPYGMILSTGPTGSGKSTTLYALLQILNTEKVNIVTLEDPIEYYMEGINQSQIKPEIGYDFARGLRHILRQDPDIIMVGEIRDEETAFLANHAAMTGHIVLSTLHTNDAVGSIPRLIDLGIKPFLIPASLSCVIAQRLVMKLCDNCKKEVKHSKEIEELILREIENLPEETKKELRVPSPLKIFEPVGCKKCKQRGFSGMIGIFEVLEITESLSRVILENPTIENLQQEAKKQGMITMFQDGILKVLNGITTIEEIMRVAEEK